MAYTIHFSGLSEGVRDHSNDIGAFLCSGQFGYPTIHNVNCGGSEATVVISGLQDYCLQQLLKPDAFPNVTIALIQCSNQLVNADYGQPVGPDVKVQPECPQLLQGQQTQWVQPQLAIGGVHSSPASESSVHSQPAICRQQRTGDRPHPIHGTDQGLFPQRINTRVPESVINSPFQATQGTPGLSPSLPAHGRPTHPDQCRHPAKQPHPEPASFRPIRPEPRRASSAAYVTSSEQQLTKPPGPHDRRLHSVQQDPMSPPVQEGHSTPHAHQGIRLSSVQEGHSTPHARQSSRPSSVQEGHGTPYTYQLQVSRLSSVQEGHSTPHAHQGSRLSSVQEGHSTPHAHRGIRPSSVQEGHGAPYAHQGIRSSSVQEGHSTPHAHQGSRPSSVQEGHSTPHAHQGIRSSSVQEGHSTPYAHQGIRSSSVQEGHSTPHAHQGIGPSSVQEGHDAHQGIRSSSVQEGHSTPYAHQGIRSSSVQEGCSTAHAHQGSRPSSVQEGHGAPHAHQGSRLSSVQEGHSTPHAHQGIRSSSVQHECLPSSEHRECRPISLGNQIHSTSVNQSHASTMQSFRRNFSNQEYRASSTSHVRPPSSTQEYHSPSRPRNIRPPSASLDTSTSEEVEEINSHSHDRLSSPMQTNQPIMVLHGGTEGQQSAVQDISVPQDGTWEHPANDGSYSTQENVSDNQNPSSQLCAAPSSNHHFASIQGVLATTFLTSVTDSPTLSEQTVVDVPTSNEGMLSAGSMVPTNALPQHSSLSQPQHQQLRYSSRQSTILMGTSDPPSQEYSSQYSPQMSQYQHSSPYPPQVSQHQGRDRPHASAQHRQYSPGTRQPLVSSRRQSLPLHHGNDSHMQYSSMTPLESMHELPHHSQSEPNPLPGYTAQWEGRYLYHGGLNTQSPRRNPRATQWQHDSLVPQDNRWQRPQQLYQPGHDCQQQRATPQGGRGLEHTGGGFFPARQLPVQSETNQNVSYGEHYSSKDPYAFEQSTSNEVIPQTNNPSYNLQYSPVYVTQSKTHVSPHNLSVSTQSANLQSGSHKTPSHQEPKCSSLQSDLKLDLEALFGNTDNTSIVKVTDLKLGDSHVDTIDAVFSNDDEGGGEIVDIDSDQLNESGFVLITFKETEVAKQVCQKTQWRVMGQTAMVSLYHKDNSSIKKLLTVARNHPQHAIIVENLPDSECDAYAFLMLEKITKLELEGSTTATYEHVGTKALMVLSDGDPKFIDSIVCKINNYSKGPKPRKDFAQISALNFPQVMKVIITGVKDEMCHEHKLQPYFANRKLSRGGPGCSVEVVDRGRAVVSFKESAHANSTLETDHEKTLGKDVTVQPYHHLFEGWLSESAAAKDAHEQQDFDYEVQSQGKCVYLEKNSHLLPELSTRLKEYCATVKLNADNKIINVKPWQGSEFIEEWKTSCTKHIEEFLKCYREEVVHIPDDISEAVRNLLLTVAKDYCQRVEVIDFQTESVSVVGPAADVSTVVERLERVVSENMDFNKEIKFAPAVLHYVHNHAGKNLKKKHPRVDFKTNLQTGCIEIMGKTAKCEKLIEALKKIKPLSASVNVSPNAIHLLASPVGREYILDKMPKPVEMWHFFTDKNDALEDAQMAVYVNLYIVADSSLSAQVHQVAKDIESSLCTKKIDVPKEFQYTVRSQAWNDFKQEVEQRCVAQLLPHAADPLVVICDHQLTEQLAQEIESFVQENCYTEETVTFSSGQWRFFFDYSREWILIEDEIKKTCKYSVEEGRSTAIHLQGETTPTRRLAKKVRSLRDSICTDTMEVSRPGLVDHFSSEEGQRHIKGVAAARKAVVEVSTAEEKEHANAIKAREEPHPVLIFGTLADGVIVEVRKGNLTEFEVDVIVNAANEQLTHGGGVAGQLSSQGGPIIQEESNQYVRRNGSVDIGKAVILKGTGDLPCKSIVHAVGPRWRGGNHNEPHLLSRAISASLTETVKKGFTSIAFPAIGAGIFGVPIEVCAKAMFEGLCRFFSMNKHQMKVIIMVYQQEHVQPFISAARKSLNDVVQPKEHVMTEHPSGTAPMARRTSSHTMASTITTDLEISDGSLLDYHADVYINSTSAGLDLNSGAVSKSLLKTGGSALQDECKRHVRQNGSVPEWGFFTSGPGNLKCRKVIHTVGGNYSKGSGRSGMETMITNVMKECDRLKASTVAFPSIGTGALGFPHNIAADIMITTVSTYLSQHRTTAIKKVLFVIFDQPVLQAFKAKEATLPAVQPQLSSASSSTRRRPSARSRGSNTPTVKLSKLSFQPQPTRPVIGTQIQQGSLTDVVTDVYVDTTSPDLDLSSRPVSQALLEAGGQALQDECTKHVQQNGNVPAWSFATTGPGALKCKHVLHTVAADYDGPGGSAEKGMEGMLHRVLEECDRLKATSVAIPSIGAGNFKFPPSVLASLMLRTVSSYLDKNRNSTVTKVLFVIYDGNLLKEFQEAQSGSAQTHPATKSKSSAAARSNECTLQCNNLRIFIVHGDITKESSEALVNTAPDNLELKNFGVQEAFLRMGGPELQAECRAVVQNEGRLSGNKIRVTGPGRMGGLKCRHVLHILAPKTPVELKGTVKAILKTVNKLGLRTVALPAIGTGQHGFKTDQAARHICEAIVEFSKHPNALLREVRIILFDESLVSDFISKFQERLGVWAALKGRIINATDAMGRWLGVGSASGISDESAASGDEEDINPSFATNFEQLNEQFPSMSLHQPYCETSYLVLSVYAQTKEIASTIIEELYAVVDKEFVTEKVKDDLIQELSDDDVAVLYRRARDLQVELDLDREVGSVTMKGTKISVGKAVLFLKEILHQIEMIRTAEHVEVEKAEKEKQEMEKQSRVAVSIYRWQRIISGQFEDFPHDVSFFIEQARVDNQPACRIPGEDGEEYEVDFASMTIRDGSGNSEKVCRFDFEEDRKQAQRQLAESEAPPTWDPMPFDPNTNSEVGCHLVDLPPHSREYQEVKQAFDATMAQGAHVPGNSQISKGIKKIERVQNRKLWVQYCAIKKVMDKTNPPGTVNERRLFHGCALNVVSSINHNGFNRSYAGKHATFYGKGMYFARDASYSSNYSIHSTIQSLGQTSANSVSANQDYPMYLAKVLVGEYTIGTKDIVVPPPKNPAHPEVLFDSTVENVTNPSIFVVFTDAQAYPDYLVTFHMQ